MEVHGILQNKSRKLKTVADNSILLKIAVYAENISDYTKIKQRTALTSKQMSANSDEIKAAPENSRTADIFTKKRKST